MVNKHKELKMAKTTMQQLLRAHMIGGVLNGSYPGASDAQNWDQYIAEHFDMNDPEVVKFLTEWKLFIDASERFNSILNEQMVQSGINVNNLL
jgi:hypothetical protein